MRTRRCDECGMQVRATIHEVENVEEMYQMAGIDPLDPDADLDHAHVLATLRFKCHCDYVDVPVSGDAKAFDVPNTWEA